MGLRYTAGTVIFVSPSCVKLFHLCVPQLGFGDVFSILPFPLFFGIQGFS